MYRSVFNRVAALAILSAATVLSAQAVAKSHNRESLQVAVSDPLNENAPGVQWITDSSPLLRAGKTPAIPSAACPVSVIATDGATSGNGRGPTTRHRFIRTHYLITAAEMAARNLAGGSLVSGIGWTYSADPLTGGTGSLVIYLENTADVTNVKSVTWATAIATMTTAHNAPTALPGAIGPFDVSFTGGTPFTYTGGGLYVAFDWQYPSPGIQSTTAVFACNSTGLVGGLKGAQSATAPPVTVATSNFRPETRLIANVADNDASSDFVMAYGELPIGLIDPDVMRANATNRGSNILSNFNFTLDVTGANSFTDAQVVPTLSACDGTDYATFAAFAPTVVGINTVTATVAPDDVGTNNVSTVRLDTTVNRYSYKQPGTSSVPGGVGVAGNTAILVARFLTNAATQVDSITLDFPTLNTTTYRLVIFGGAGNGLPLSPAIYEDAADRTIGTAGPRTIRLPAPVAVGPGDFFVGINQTNTINAGLGFANENPIRTGSFFGVIPNTATAWFDLAPGANFKLNLGVILGACLVPLAADVTPNAATTACPGANINYTATPAGGTGNLTYQWTENGVDIAGATSSTYAANKAAPGTFTYNCKITDDGACVNQTDATDSTGIWAAPAAAAVTGDNAICSGGMTGIQAALTGLGPWNITWSDGFVQNGVTSSPATRTVNPLATTVYTITSVTDACGAGTASGSATVTVSPGPLPPEVAPNVSVGDFLGWSTDKTTLNWPAAVGVSTYNVYRGTLATLPALLTGAVESCTRYSGAANSATGISENTTPGGSYWFIVTGTGPTGCEGPAGTGAGGPYLVNSSGVCP